MLMRSLAAALALTGALSLSACVTAPGPDEVRARRPPGPSIWTASTAAAGWRSPVCR